MRCDCPLHDRASEFYLDTATTSKHWLNKQIVYNKAPTIQTKIISFHGLYPL